MSMVGRRSVRKVGSKSGSKKDMFDAKIAFYLSLGLWVPLLNIAICLTSLIFSFRALRSLRQDPRHFGGRGYIVAALVLSLTGLVLTLIGLVFYYFFHDAICGSAMCQAYYASS